MREEEENGERKEPEAAEVFPEPQQSPPGTGKYGLARILINLDDMTNQIAFTNPEVGKAFNQHELAFIVNPLLWHGIKALLDKKFGASEIVAPTAGQVIQLNEEFIKKKIH